MGPNGSGKSTLLGAIAGLHAVQAGTVSVDERMLTGPDVHLRPELRRVGLLGQDPLLFPHLSALENIAFGPRSVGVPRHEALEAARSSLAELGLEGFEHRRPGQLSGGQQQRVAVARALAADPDVLLLDEPMAALDVDNARLMRELLAEKLAASGTPAIIVTHDVADAFALASRTVLLNEGRVVRDGDTAEVLATLGVGSRVDGVVGPDGRVQLPDGIELAPGQQVTVTVQRDAHPVPAHARATAARAADNEP
ncbi:MAG TPA: ATP-binding cassette domain-containing protein, partial [Terrimesophilobacter sp.]|nr:ATP-binding cassette domain-containing protein [Terrimesophilobacter sp.]